MTMQIDDAEFGEFLAQDTEQPDWSERATEFLESDIPDQAESFDEPDTSIIKGQRRKNGAAGYEKKTASILSFLTKLAVQRPGLQADAAAFIMHAPTVAEKVGDLAAVDDKIARGIDFLTEGTESPYLAAMIAVSPLLLQLMRNHEPVLEPAPRGFRIPFSKRRIRIPFKFGIRLGGLKAMTNDPDKLASYVLSHPKVLAAFEKQGINVASG